MANTKSGLVNMNVKGRKLAKGIVAYDAFNAPKKLVAAGEALVIQEWGGEEGMLIDGAKRNGGEVIFLFCTVGKGKDLRVIGFSELMIFSRPDGTGREVRCGFFCNNVVLEEFRRQKIATAFISFRLLYASEFKCERGIAEFEDAFLRDSFLKRGLTEWPTPNMDCISYVVRDEDGNLMISFKVKKLKKGIVRSVDYFVQVPACLALEVQSTFFVENQAMIRSQRWDGCDELIWKSAFSALRAYKSLACFVKKVSQEKGVMILDYSAKKKTPELDLEGKAFIAPPSGGDRYEFRIP